uniref:ARAD1C13926p n=1 Tax=Blastobotrys adeninivorans TaxID=409370 RepID=A0A060T0K7_BLAAD
MIRGLRSVRRPIRSVGSLRSLGPLERAFFKPQVCVNSVRFKSGSGKDSEHSGDNVPDKSQRSSIPQTKKGDNETVTPFSQASQNYVPQNVHQRVTYEYPPPPGETPFKPAETSPYRRHLPILVAVAGIAWAAYAYKHFIAGDSSSEESLLDPGHFVKFKITYREDLTDDLALIELSPKSDMFRKALRKKGGLWNGKKLWSVEVKQPDIQVVRRYTPLPLYFMQYKDPDNNTKALMRLIGSGEDEGRMVLLVKKYHDGEVSRYIHGLPVGHDVELRGPFVGYRFPYTPIDSTEPRDPMEDLPSRMRPEYPHPEGIPHPDNIAFFAAGTGIAPILQSLWSKNPPRGRVDVYYSVRDQSHIPFKRFLLFLEKTGRAKFHYFVDNENKFIQGDDIPKPIARAKHVIDPSLDKELERELKLKRAMDELRREKYGQTVNENKDEESNLEANLVPIPEVTELESSNDPKPEGPTDDIGPRRKYRSVLEQVADPDSPKDTRGPAIAVVCGPEGYITYLAGPRNTNKEPIGGLLGEKGWNNDNAFRMES